MCWWGTITGSFARRWRKSSKGKPRKAQSLLSGTVVLPSELPMYCNAKKARCKSAVHRKSCLAKISEQIKKGIFRAGRAMTDLSTVRPEGQLLMELGFAKL